MRAPASITRDLYPTILASVIKIDTIFATTGNESCDSIGLDFETIYTVIVKAVNKALAFRASGENWPARLVSRTPVPSDAILVVSSLLLVLNQANNLTQHDASTNADFLEERN